MSEFQNPEKENATAKKIPDLVNVYLNQIGRWKLLPDAIQVEIFKEKEKTEKNLRERASQSNVNEKDRLAKTKEMLMLANLRLVVHISKKYLGHGLDLLDLIQEGNIGLMKAIDRYDYRLGSRFATYATWWIRQSIQRALQSKGALIVIPSHMLIKRKKLERNRQKSLLTTGHSASTTLLGDLMGISEESVEKISNIVTEPHSLDSLIGEDGNSKLGDILEQTDHEPPERTALNRDLAFHTEEALRELPDREAEILRLRFGFYDRQEKTLEEIGQKFGLTRERIRQLEERALAKFTKAAGEKNLKALIFN